jgi:hypothetical protein
MPIGPMGEPLPYNGPAGPPMGGPMPGAMPGGGPQDEVGQLLALREQIDQRLAELMGGPPPGGVPAPMPMDAAMPPGLLA